MRRTILGARSVDTIRPPPLRSRGRRRPGNPSVFDAEPKRRQIERHYRQCFEASVASVALEEHMPLTAQCVACNDQKTKMKLR